MMMYTKFKKTRVNWQRDAGVLLLDPRVMEVLNRVVLIASTRQTPESCEKELVRLKARLVSRIFHGIPSPRFKHGEWSESPFWNRYSAWGFEAVYDCVVGETA
jgi:hypothetical protein